MDLIASWLRQGDYLPHGYCFTWSPGLLWSMVGADGIIAAAYYSIPVALLSFTRQRGDLTFKWVLWLFSAFIFACGTTHLLSIWTVWHPDYGIEAIAKMVTAAISIVTAIALWPLIPRALKIPSVRELQTVIDRLEAEVTQRRVTEERLIDTQESLAVTLASIGAGFIATDREGRITAMNPVAESVTGWPLAEAHGCSLWQVLRRELEPEGQLQTNPVDVVQAMNRPPEVATRNVVIGRHGARTPIEANVAVTRGVDGAARGIVIVFRDMTLLDQAQTESQQLAALVNSSGDAIIGKTLEGHITSWNQGAAQLFGYTAQEVLGRPVTILIPPDVIDEETRILGELAQGQNIAPFDTTRLHKNGTLLAVSVAVSPIRDASGAVIGASKIARDISAQRHNEELRLRAIRLEAQNQQIQEANRLKSEFLANMSHELRTPLNAIIGFADLLHMGQVSPDSPKHRDFLGHIRTSGRHLLQLINDVLDLAKVESGKFEFHPEPIDLPRVVGEVTGMLHNTAAAKGLTVEVDVDPALDGVVLDPARLKQVLYNYVSNAIKFTPAGGRVTVRATGLGGWLRLEVQDTGIGIAAQDLNRLFVEFQQLDSGSTKAHSGTGLGLALTRRLVEAQGGEVGVHSELGVGSVFSAILPRVAAANPLPAAATVPRVALPGGPRILIVEDDPTDQASLAEVLTDAGFQVEVASSAAQAIRFATTRSYAAVTLDLLLPDSSGLEVLNAMRADGPNRETPTVVVTMVTEQATLAGFAVSGVLVKPVHKEALLSALRKAGVVEQPAATVLVIDDDEPALALMLTTLETIGVRAVGIQDGRSALRQLDTLCPDAIILDLVMPEFDGFAVLDRLRSLPRWHDVPVFIWTSATLSAGERAALTASATRIVEKGSRGIASLLDELRALTARTVRP